MNQPDMDALIQRLEREATLTPVTYRRKLGALALLGYGYVFGILVLLVSGLASLVWFAAFKPWVLIALKKLWWAIGLLIYVVVRAMWVTLDPPSGRRVTREEYPRLFGIIEQLRRKAQAPHLSEVLITDDLNAGVVQHTRFGIFGGVRNYLLLGLPLMQALSPQELQAVVAHEFGHLSRAHGRFGAWIYRLRLGWMRLLHALEQQQHFGTQLFTRFFGWYAPLFNAYSFVQARQQEYEADRISAAAVGAKPAASALLRVHAQEDFMQKEFWPAVFQRTQKEPAPVVSPFAMLGPALKEASVPKAAPAWFVQSLANRTDHADTHPCLADRLKALGVQPEIPEPLQSSAADEYLGKQGLERLLGELDASWRSKVSSWWEEKHQENRDARARLVQLNEKAAVGPLTDEELWDRARLTEDVESDEAAAPLYAELLGRNAQHVSALWRYGVLLLARGDASGVEKVQAAAYLDTDLQLPACSVLLRFYRRKGDQANVKTYEARYEKLAAAAEVTRRERSQVLDSDKVTAHGLDDAALVELVAGLERIGNIKRALLARKVLTRDSTPLYVLALESALPWWKLRSSSGESELVEQVSRECSFPGETFIISLREHASFRKRFAALARSEIYHAGT